MPLPYSIKFDIDRTINKNNISEYRVERTIPSENVTFSIKMRYVNCDKIFYNIYLLSSKTVSIRCSLLFAYGNQTKAFVLTKPEMEDNYFTLECNKWYFINIHKVDIFEHSCLFFYYEINKYEKDLLSKELGNNYLALLKRGDFTDIITMKSVEGNEHKVHKALLVSRSEVLKAHFEHDTTESKTNVVESPLENQVLVDVLTYIYCNIVPSIEDIPEKLLAASDYYQLHEMKSLCEEKLKEKLCVDNALDTLQLADLHSAETLKQFTFEYIKHQIVLIIKTEAWAKMEPTTLLKDIIEYIVADGIGHTKYTNYNM